MKSYLKDREFCVSLNKVLSSKKTVNIGIPQGSILGPILFVIYINDLPHVSNLFSTTLYADDTNFSFNHSNYIEMFPVINRELAKIHDWNLSNRLTINHDKTELLLFSKRNIPPCNDQIFLDINPIDWVGHAKFLGILLTIISTLNCILRMCWGKFLKTVEFFTKLEIIYPFVLESTTITPSYYLT